MSAFVLPNRNVVIPGLDGKASCRLTRGSMTTVPDWVPETPYFKALVADGKVVLTQSKKDKDVRRGKSAADKARKAAEEEARKAAAEAEEEPGEEQDDPGE